MTKLGVETIDDAHKLILDEIERYIYLFKTKEDSYFDRKNIAGEMIESVAAHESKHFMEEEAFMESAGYSLLEEHKKIHSRIRDSFGDFLTVLLKSQADQERKLCVEFLTNLKTQLTDHIELVDSGIVSS